MDSRQWVCGGRWVANIVQVDSGRCLGCIGWMGSGNCGPSAGQKGWESGRGGGVIDKRVSGRRAWDVSAKVLP